MAANRSLIQRVISQYLERQHLLLIVLCLFLLPTSGYLMMGRALRKNASFWDISHVYLGLLACFIAVTFLVTNVMGNKWRQYFPWLTLDFSQLLQDIKGLFKGRLPQAGGRGLFSCVEGLGMLIMVAVGITGAMWFVLQGTTDALMWRNYHIMAAKGLMGFLALHVIFAALHLLDFIRN
ncbi:cytochrome b/b6 domain-containing protein [Shewanella waksmanii]|uniref:cytochrome b/b6 domain-containing protein n=1 Tax=Shewanella waksmanii TaxID=213783 RepID=UPI0004918B30|nr:cytochrome b/b6 domain-containing protein [Shewanella waksmanii]